MNLFKNVRLIIGFGYHIWKLCNNEINSLFINYFFIFQFFLQPTTKSNILKYSPIHGLSRVPNKGIDKNYRLETLVNMHFINILKNVLNILLKYSIKAKHMHFSILIGRIKSNSIYIKESSNIEYISPNK